MSLKRRLAGACARGWRQQSLVNELLVGPAPVYEEQFGDTTYVKYGVSGVQGSSFRNLRRRLVAVGFVIQRNMHTRTLTMKFPEEEP